MMRLRSIAFAAFAVSALTACTINPVTGERELALVSAVDEVAIGTEQYAPSRQMQGGDYVREPELTAYVNEVGQKLAAVSDRDLPYEFVVLNSSVPNAWALPGGKIAVNRGLLLELQSEAELAAVLGHEIVHAAARHGALAMQRGILLQSALAVATVATRKSDYSDLAVGAAGLGAQLINQKHGRAAELESDRYGIEYMARAGYDPAAAVTLQETFVRLSEGRNEDWLSGLFASHPPSQERVDRNRETAAMYPAGGELGRERYAMMTAGLQATREAYAAYDDGRKALEAEDFAAAERNAQQAARLVSDEAIFDGLLGEIDYRQERYADAVRHFDAAIAKDDGFFYHSLGKGLSHLRLEQWSAAETSLTTSAALLPTSGAYYGLGVCAEQRGDIAAAIENYRQAAGSQDAAGQAALAALVRLDLPRNPGEYLSVRTGLDGSGLLVIELGNPTPVSVADVGVRVRYQDQQGAVQELRRVAAGPFAAHASQQFSTGLGPFPSPNAYEVTLDSARVVAQ
jgi:predicted Zn-dependent protease